MSKKHQSVSKYLPGTLKIFLRIGVISFFATIFFVLSVPDLSLAQGFLKSFALIEAAEKGQKKEVEKLLNQGANVNVQDEYGDSSILAASKRGFVDIVRILVDKGANVNTVDADGSSPLIEASKFGHLEVVKLLLACGADVKLKDKDNETALTYATQNELQEIKELLIKYEAQ